MQTENTHAGDAVQGNMAQLAMLDAELTKAGGTYHVECFDADGNLKWADDIINAVTQEGKVVGLKNTLNASAFTQVSYLGLISATGYTTPPANTNTAAQINIAASANGWNEVVSSVVAARGTPSWGTSTGSAGNASLATTAVAFSILNTLVIKGCFLVLKDLAAAGPSATVGSTTGALYSAGLFTGGDKSVNNGDTLNVTYTANLT